jgi:hypothetical protein
MTPEHPVDYVDLELRVPEEERLRRVLMSEELFRALGADRVDWGLPDDAGFYTPTLYRDYRPSRLSRLLRWVGLR